MGYMNALGMAEAVNDGYAQLRTAVSWHLQVNHFPPVHQVFVPVAMEAIEHARLDDFDHVIDMPNGISKTVGSIVDELHLDAFCVEFEETDEDGIPYGEEHDEDGSVL